MEMRLRDKRGRYLSRQAIFDQAYLSGFGYAARALELMKKNGHSDRSIRVAISIAVRHWPENDAFSHGLTDGYLVALGTA